MINVITVINISASEVDFNRLFNDYEWNPKNDHIIFYKGLNSQRYNVK